MLHVGKPIFLPTCLPFWTFPSIVQFLSKSLFAFSKYPFSKRERTVWLPIYPHPPVTNIVFIGELKTLKFNSGQTPKLEQIVNEYNYLIQKKGLQPELQRTNKPKKNHKKNFNSAIVNLFIDAKADELTKIFKGGNLNERRQAFNLLSEISPSNIDIFNKILEWKHLKIN